MVHNGDGTLDDFHTMMVAPGILAMTDGPEPDSEDRNSIDLAIGYATALGADVTILDLRDLELPIYDPQRERDGLPQGAHAFRQLLCAHDGLLVALPTRERDRPPLLLNAVAWSICPAFGIDAAAAYAGKCAALVPAIGGEDMRGQHVADVGASLVRLGVLIVPAPLSGGPARTLEEQMSRFVQTIRAAQTQGDFTAEDDGDA